MALLIQNPTQYMNVNSPYILAHAKTHINKGTIYLKAVEALQIPFWFIVLLKIRF